LLAQHYTRIFIAFVLLSGDYVSENFGENHFNKLIFVLCALYFDVESKIAPSATRPSTKIKVQSTSPTTDMPIRIYNPNDRAIRRRIFTPERKARFLSPAPENQFTHTGSGSVNRNQRFTLRRKILVERSNN